MKTFEENIEVRDSGIHGLGIFAQCGIPENELIMIITGDVIDEKECIRREEEENNVYIFWNGDNYIDTEKSDKIKYINHHCAPNCIIEDGDSGSLRLVSARYIQPDEEITIDYGYDEIYENCKCSKCS